MDFSRYQPNHGNQNIRPRNTERRRHNVSTNAGPSCPLFVAQLRIFGDEGLLV
jgi:hypothetical protein